MARLSIAEHADRVLSLQQQIRQAEADQAARTAAHVETIKRTPGATGAQLISQEITQGRRSIMQLQQRLRRAMLDHDRAVVRAEAAYLADPHSYQGIGHPNPCDNPTSPKNR